MTDLDLYKQSASDEVTEEEFFDFLEVIRRQNYVLPSDFKKLGYELGFEVTLDLDDCGRVESFYLERMEDCD